MRCGAVHGTAAEGRDWAKHGTRVEVQDGLNRAETCVAGRRREGGGRRAVMSCLGRTGACMAGPD